MASKSTNWLRSILFGYREIQTNGVPVIQRDTANIVGLTVLDDPINKRTNITFAGAYIPTSDPIADTVVSRNPSGGTSLTALSVYDTVPPTGAQTAYINGTEGTMYADNGFSFETTTVERVQPYHPIYSDTLWSFTSTGRLVSSANTASSVHFDLDIPDGATLLSVDVWILPAGSHAGLPATRPTINLTRVEVLTSTTTLMAGELDQSADVTEYELPHAITLDAGATAPLSPTVVDNSDSFYRVKFTSEASTNALLGCMILGIIATYTTTTYRK